MKFIRGENFTFIVKQEWGATKIVYTGIFYGDKIALSYTYKASGHRSSHTRSLQNRFGDAEDESSPTVTFTAMRVE